ncbi:hypothetical protein ACQQ2N_14370 [Dokdonella sp. MW10]|uniref:hypothetical protein n=1 Tax=Dokdonella sp. MW10 TaxID=2992926 RepID=UPI003F7D238D
MTDPGGLEHRDLPRRASAWIESRIGRAMVHVAQLDAVDRSARDLQARPDVEALP